MLDPDIKITRQMEDARWTREGNSEPDIRVEFFVGAHGPFAERFKKTDYTADARDRKLNDFAREVRTS